DLGRRHRADREVRKDGRAVRAGEARGAVRLGVAEGRRTGAQPLPSALALPAAQARRIPRQRDLPADGRRIEARTDRLDDARALVAEDDRARADPVAVADVQIGVADAGGGQADEDLARARLVEPQRLDGRPRAGALDDGGLDLAHDTTMPDPGALVRA